MFFFYFPPKLWDQNKIFKKEEGGVEMIFQKNNKVPDEQHS